MIRQRNVPPNAVPLPFNDVQAVAYCYERGRGDYVAKAFSGRRSKADFHLAFDSDDARARYLEQWAGKLREKSKARSDARTARLTCTHNLRLGDVLVSTWGYEQTNADFFQVVRVVSDKSVILRALARTVAEDAPAAMTGYALPVRNEYDPAGKAFQARVTPSGFKIDRTRGFANRWDGRPVRVTWYA